MSKVKIEIKHRYIGSVLFSYESEGNTIKETLVKAVDSGADLSGADLIDSNLRGADLSGADLSGADLYGADLRYANLRGANLSDANLRYANLRGADLYGADLRYANLRGANLSDANLSDANLSDANLSDANLRGMTMDKLPVSYINSCSRDILFILNHLESEVPALKAKLIAGEVDGTKYEGECACLVGSLAVAKDTDVSNLCTMIPYYEKGTHNPAEQWFLHIHEGDTPENNEFAKHALKLCNQVLGLPHDDGLYTEVEQEVREVSMDEVARAMGISVGSLRIKKEL